jgi:hypothetical protein
MSMTGCLDKAAFIGGDAQAFPTYYAGVGIQVSLQTLHIDFPERG